MAANLDSLVGPTNMQCQQDAFYYTNNYTNNYVSNARKPQNQTICADLQHLALDHAILVQADKLLASLPLSFPRYTPKKQMILLALYEVHRLRNEAVDPFYLGRLLSLTVKQVRQAFTKYYSYINSKDPGYISPLDLITSTAKKLECSADLILEISEYSKRLVERHPELTERGPQLVASALVVYYLALSGYELDMQRVAIKLSPYDGLDYSSLDPKQINLYCVSLANMVKIIQSLDNK